MSDEFKNLKERMSELSNDDLLQIVQTDFADYRKEALDIAKTELERRGLSVTLTNTDKQIHVPDESIASLVESPTLGSFGTFNDGTPIPLSYWIKPIRYFAAALFLSAFFHSGIAGLL